MFPLSRLPEEKGDFPTILDSFHRNSAERASRARHCPLFPSRNQVFESRDLSTFQLSTLQTLAFSTDSLRNIRGNIPRLTSSLGRVSSSSLLRSFFEGRTREFDRRFVRLFTVRVEGEVRGMEEGTRRGWEGVRFAKMVSFPSADSEKLGISYAA